MSAPTLMRGAPAARPPQAGNAEAERGNPTLTAGSTLVGAVALLAGSSALSASVSGTEWVAPVVEVVAVIWLIGVGARMIRMPTGFVVLLQVIGLTVAMTSLFTSGGIAGTIPNGQVLSEAGQLLSGAWSQILLTVPPAPSTPELAFLIALAVGVAELIVDFLIAEAKAPALVALPLLCLYSVPASISTHILPWYTFAAPAVLYALLLAIAEHPGRRTGMRAGAGMAGNGLVVAALAAVVSLLVADSVTLIGTTGRLPHTNSAGSQVGLSPFTTLHGSLQESQAVNLISVAGLTTPDYLRTVALETWTEGQGFSIGTLKSDQDDLNGSLPGAAIADGPKVTVTSTNYRDRFLPLLQGTSSISGLSPGWSFDSSLGTAFRSNSVNPDTYVLQTTTERPSVADLEADTVDPGGVLTDVGDSLPPSVTTLAQTVTADTQTAFDKAQALEHWFTNPANGFTYSLSVPTGNTGNALTDFLANKTGYCEQYASAMAIMLRTLNIPARVAIGFTQGVKQTDGSYLITSHDAHAWVEVNFDQNGWVRFDPTPVVDGQGGQDGFEDGTVPAAGAAPTASVTGATPTVKPSALQPDGALTSSSPVPVTVTSQDISAGGTGNGSGGLSAGWFLAIVILVLLLGAILSMPALVRRSRRRKRVRAAGDGRPGAASAAWAEIEDTAIDYGFFPHAAESARVTANRIARLSRLSPEHRAQLREIVVAAEQEWYAGAAPGAAAGGGQSPGGMAVDLRPQLDLAAAVQAILQGFRALPKLPMGDRLVPRSLRSRNR